MTSDTRAPYVLGDTRATMGWTAGSEPVMVSKTLKPSPSSDCGLKPAHMKPESLVIADQPRRGEYVPGPCTHRPSSHPSCGHPKTVTLRGAVEGERGEGG